MAEKTKGLKGVSDRLKARSVLDLVESLNREKEWFMKEVFGMAGIRDWFKEEFEERDNKIAEQGETISDLNKQLHNKDEQLQSKDAENTRLRQEVERLKRQLEGGLARGI